ncbi:phytoene desaturase family protein [Caldalkalibacillus salinus]|uniref:phytoene desaturase family protein n=1 Tax=Caldalkalibacillus salinus TaxID=2803787 RepID=UPI001924CC74|nr:NAD(P)/FAD-dependent oxidoreductase [Caldalkalibacillus salinus]
MDKYDVLIIGAGLGGLTCGARLAQYGYRVAVFERHHIPGGYATNFRRKGPYTFDVSLHGLGGLGEHQSFTQLLKKCWVHQAITPIKKEYPYTVWWQGEVIHVPSDPKAYFNLLIDMFPQQRTGLIQLFQDLQKFYHKLKQSQRAQTYGFNDNDRLTTWSKLTLAEMLNLYIDDPLFIAFFSANWSYYGLPPRRLAALYFIIPWISYHFEGTYYIRGGAQALSDSLVHVIQQHGGHVYLNHVVQQILANTHGAYGLLTEKGAMFRGQWVVSNASPPRTMSLLSDLNLISESYRRKLSEAEIGPSITQLYLGLKHNPIDVHEDLFMIDETDSEISFEYHQKGDASKVNLGLTNYQKADPLLNHQDKQVLSLFYIDYIHNWPKERRAYLERKEEVIGILMNRLAEIYPGIQSYVDVIELGTPRTMQRYTDNPQGAIYGYAQTVSLSGIARLKQRTPVKGLSFTGAWTRPGGGYQGVAQSGVMEAERIHKQLLKQPLQSQHVEGGIPL